MKPDSFGGLPESCTRTRQKYCVAGLSTGFRAIVWKPAGADARRRKKGLGLIDFEAILQRPHHAVAQRCHAPSRLERHGRRYIGRAIGGDCQSQSTVALPELGGTLQ